MRAFKFLMAVAVLGCIAASATFAFEFGWSRGATDVHRWTYALAGVALDLLKAGLPIFGAMAWHDRSWTRSGACWFAFLVLTGLSLLRCLRHHGNAARRAAGASHRRQRRQRPIWTTTRDRLRKQRDALVFTETSADAVRTAEAAVKAAADQVKAERDRGGCKDICRQREADERTALEVLRKTQADRAAIKAATLDAKIADARRSWARSMSRRQSGSPTRSPLQWPRRSAPTRI